MTVPNKILRVLQNDQSLRSREIAERLDASWSTVKRHLDALLEAGQVQREKDGRITRYRLVTAVANYQIVRLRSLFLLSCLGRLRVSPCASL